MKEQTLVEMKNKLSIEKILFCEEKLGISSQLFSERFNKVSTKTEILKEVRLKKYIFVKLNFLNNNVQTVM